jgi:hypothetical protein
VRISPTGFGSSPITVVIVDLEWNVVTTDGDPAESCSPGVELIRLEVCTEMGMGPLTQTPEPARAILDVDNIDVVADRGYFKIEDIEVYGRRG